MILAHYIAPVFSLLLRQRGRKCLRIHLPTKYVPLLRNAGYWVLPEQDCVNANEFLQYHEYALAFDTILTQMYEFDIPINTELYQEIETIARRMVSWKPGTTRLWLN